MTVTTQTNRTTGAGTGAQTAFTFDFKALAAADLRVYVDGVLKTLTTHYTVAISSGINGGTVTFLSAPANGAEILILRVMTLTQGSALPTVDRLSHGVIENALDKLTMIVQQLEENVARCIQVAETYTGTVSLELPEPEANRALVWNDDGDALENSDTDPDEAADEAAASAAAALSSANAADSSADAAATSASAASSSASAAAASAAAAAASAASITLPSITGNTLKLLGANAGETALEYKTQAQVMAQATPTTTKGDIIAHSTIATRLAVGTNGKVLTAASGEATGLEWATPVQPATQAEMETASAVNVYVTPGRQKHHPLHPKARINFNGTGTVAVREAVGFTGVTDNGSGNYTANLTDTYSNNSYCMSGLAMRDSDNTCILQISGSATYGNSVSTTAFAVKTKDENGASVDAIAVCLEVSGDLP